MEVKSVTDLPFVKMDGDQIVSMWCVEKGSDFVMDNRRGRCYANRLIDLMKQDGNQNLFLRVVRDMNMSDISGIEVGFFSTVASKLIGL